MIHDPALLCVDTRGSMAYRIGHLPGSVNIRDDYVEDMLGHGNPFPGRRILVFVCPVGEYSRRLAAFLRQAGHLRGEPCRAAWWPGATRACCWKPA